MAYDKEHNNRIRQMWRNQRASAKGCDTAFLLTFEQWLSIWLKSGHFKERGCRKGQYVMGRIGDKGPYSINNVKIITVEQNLAESWSRPSQQKAHRRNMRSRRGKKRTVGFTVPGLYTKYKNHKARAQRQDIGFELTFEDWFRIWQESGNLANRGPRADQFVMARFDDTGPYKVGNVKIVTRRANIAERKISAKGKIQLGDAVRAANIRRFAENKIVWITDGTAQQRVVLGAELPVGWWLGRTVRAKFLGVTHECACGCKTLIPGRSTWVTGHCNRGRKRPDASIRMKAYNESRRKL